MSRVTPVPGLEISKQWGPVLGVITGPLRFPPGRPPSRQDSRRIVSVARVRNLKMNLESEGLQSSTSPMATSIAVAPIRREISTTRPT